MTPSQLLLEGVELMLFVAKLMSSYAKTDLLILDEPLQGLDPLNRQLIRRFVDVLISEGETQLLFVSHHAEDAPACITHRLEFVADGDSYCYRTGPV